MIFQVAVSEEANTAICNLIDFMKQVYNLAIDFLLKNNPDPRTVFNKEREIRRYVRQSMDESRLSVFNIQSPEQKQQQHYSAWEKKAIRYALQRYKRWKYQYSDKPSTFNNSFPISIPIDNIVSISNYTDLGIELESIDDLRGKEAVISDRLKQEVGKDQGIWKDMKPIGAVSIVINRKRYKIVILASDFMIKVLKKRFNTFLLPLIIKDIKKVQIFSNTIEQLLCNITFGRYSWARIVDDIKEEFYDLGTPYIHRDFNEKYDTKKIIDDTIYLEYTKRLLDTVVSAKIKRLYALVKSMVLDDVDEESSDFIKFKEYYLQRGRFRLFLYKDEYYLWLYLQSLLKDFAGFFTKKGEQRAMLEAFSIKRGRAIKLHPVLVHFMIVNNTYAPVIEYIISTDTFAKLFEAERYYPYENKYGIIKAARMAAMHPIEFMKVANMKKYSVSIIKQYAYRLMLGQINKEEDIPFEIKDEVLKQVDDETKINLYFGSGGLI